MKNDGVMERWDESEGARERENEGVMERQGERTTVWGHGRRKEGENENGRRGEDKESNEF